MPEPIAQVISNGDRTAKLGLAFEHLAAFTEVQHQCSMTAMTKLLEPLLIVVMGGIIAVVAIALLLPLFQAGRIMSG